MNGMINPRGIVDRVHPGQGITDMAGAGFSELVLDLSFLCPPHELEAAQKGEKVLSESMGRLLAGCAKANMLHSVGAAPRLSRDAGQKDLNGRLKKLAEESIQICGMAGCRYVIVSPLFSGIQDEDLWNTNCEFYLQLGACAKKQGVMLLLENQCRNVNGHLVRGLCSDGREAAEWVDRLNEKAGEPLFGFCVDVGICNLCGQNMHDFIVALGDRVKAVILRDCDGLRENSMLPFTCVNQGQRQTDWLNLIRGLRQVEFDGSLILNLEDTASGFSPILRPGLLQLAKSVMDYMKWQIEIEGRLKKFTHKVLFGAGNMSRNYMKCYGETEPPLYVCDNNEALWGTAFCGLEVKSPECLKSLPSEYTIFISNMYYREIEAQLRRMGVTNRIEYFNDEYMPSFYFDRLEIGGR